MTKLLLDANISPETATYLEEALELDVVDLITRRQHGLSDEDVVRIAKQEGRVIVTFDLDFGEIYHFRERGTFGIIILRLEDQTVESVNRVLGLFFRTEAQTVDLERSLVVIEEGRIRIVRGH